MSEHLQPIQDDPEDTSLEFPAVQVDEAQEPEHGSTEPYEPLPQNEAPVPAAPPTRSFWDKVRGWLGMGEPVAQRFDDLNRAIEMNPESAVNYVLRGELYFQSREYALAQADFQHGLTLAQQQYEANAWGLVAQSVQDRAVAGLQRVRRKLTTEPTSDPT